jgi:CBS domain containing-hemolysin-like protein
MVPRVDVVGLSRFDSVADLRRVSRESGHSRFPIFGEDRDEIVGVVHVKDTFQVPSERRSITPVSHIAKPALVVPESRHLDDLLVDMQRQSRALAFVVDEYGALAGIVTIEDLLEEIFGEISDEHDTPRPTMSPNGQEGAQQVEIRGLANRHDVEDELGIELPEGHFETLGGFLISRIGRFPEAGEKITYGSLVFEVLAMDGHRIDRVGVTRMAGQL